MVVQQKMQELVEVTQRATSQRNATLVESLVGIETVKFMVAESAFQRKWEQTTVFLAQTGTKLKLLSSSIMSMVQFLQQFVTVVVVIVGVYLLIDNQLSMGGIIAASMLAGRAMAPFGQVAGLLMGLFGAVLLASTRGGLGLDAINPYAGLILLATLLYAFNVNFLKFRLAAFPPVENAVMALTMAGLPAIVWLGFDLDFQDRLEVATIQHPAVLSVLALGVLGSAVGTLLFNRMIKDTSPVFASSVTYVIPFVAVSIGLFVGEPFTWLQGAGMLATVGGVWLANKRS
jgi:drug/metabolite transporter (DMT)-like permease